MSQLKLDQAHADKVAAELIKSKDFNAVARPFSSSSDTMYIRLDRDLCSWGRTQVEGNVFYINEPIGIRKTKGIYVDLIVGAERDVEFKVSLDTDPKELAKLILSKVPSK